MNIISVQSHETIVPSFEISYNSLIPLSECSRPVIDEKFNWTSSFQLLSPPLFVRNEARMAWNWFPDYFSGSIVHSKFFQRHNSQFMCNEGLFMKVFSYQIRKKSISVQYVESSQKTELRTLCANIRGSENASNFVDCEIERDHSWWINLRGGSCFLLEATANHRMQVDKLIFRSIYLSIFQLDFEFFYISHICIFSIFYFRCFCFLLNRRKSLLWSFSRLKTFLQFAIF